MAGQAIGRMAAHLKAGHLKAGHLKAAHLMALGLLGMGAALHAQPAPDRATFVASLFTERAQADNFARINQLFPVDPVAPSTHPRPWPVGPTLDLPARFAGDGGPIETARFLADTDTAALLVLVDGQIRYEHYWLSGGPHVRWISMSVAKSAVSAMIGAALAEGRIASIADPVTRYLPELAGSAYDGVAIKDILQMSSGARWTEDYADRTSDIFRLGALMATGGSFAAFPASLPRQFAPGTFNRYNSADTLVLGILLERVTGKTLAAYTAEKLWEPLGATDQAYWLTDDRGMAMAFGGFNATARDYARIGELYRLGGVSGGRQVIPTDWVHASVTPDSPHVMPGKRASSDTVFGYGYQWWVPGGADTQDFSAIGVYNQFIYVNPRAHMVIVKLSANHAYGRTNDDRSWRETDHFALFRAIASSR